jgi:cytochrome P450
MFYFQYLTPNWLFEPLMPMGVYKREIEQMIPDLIKHFDDLGKSANVNNKAFFYQMIEHDPEYRDKAAKPAVEEFMEMMWGGRESIGHALTSCTYQILTRPECQERLH